MSAAYNGGRDHVLRWTGATADSVTFADVPDLFDDDVSRGWALASTATDLDGDLLPELYVANDFGPDRLLHNRSTPGRVRLALVEGEGSRLTVPKSKILGHDSFKGMGVDVGDLDGDGVLDSATEVQAAMASGALVDDGIVKYFVCTLNKMPARP